MVRFGPRGRVCGLGLQDANEKVSVNEQSNGKPEPEGGNCDRMSEVDDKSKTRTEYKVRIPSDLPGEPRILTRSEHPISRKMIDRDALKVMYRLNRNGFKAFLVGGAVRDLFLGKQPKDFDIGTDATTKDVRALFRNSRIIGRRFKLNHVYFRGNKIVEVSTFRKNNQTDSVEKNILLSSDNTYGDAETDALRRDLTINGLFYDVSSYSVIDYVGGIDDLQNGIVKFIGEPEIRVQEDPVRMLRVTRHASRTGFDIEEGTFSALEKHKQLLSLCPTARVYEELLKEFKGGCARESFQLLSKTGLLPYLLPALPAVDDSQTVPAWECLSSRLEKLDRIVAQDGSFAPGVIFAALYLKHFPLDLYSHMQASAEEGAFLRTLWGLSDGLGWDGIDQLFADVEKRTRVIDLFEQILSDFFKPIGVTRRERESLESCLIGRISLLRKFCFWKEHPASSPPVNLVKKGFFKDSLRLLELSAVSSEELDCLEFWQKLAARHKNSLGSNKSGGQQKGRGRRKLFKNGSRRKRRE